MTKKIALIVIVILLIVVLIPNIVLAAKSIGQLIEQFEKDPRELSVDELDILKNPPGSYLSGPAQNKQYRTFISKYRTKLANEIKRRAVSGVDTLQKIEEDYIKDYYKQPLKDKSLKELASIYAESNAMGDFPDTKMKIAAIRQAVIDEATKRGAVLTWNANHTMVTSFSVPGESHASDQGGDAFEARKKKLKEDAERKVEEELKAAGFYNDMYVNPLFADNGRESTTHSTDEVITEGENFLNSGNQEVVDQNALKNTSNTLYNILLALGTVAAVVVGIFLGLKFFLSAVEEKAEIKKLLVPYFVGCFVLFGAFGIWKLVILTLNL